MIAGGANSGFPLLSLITFLPTAGGIFVCATIGLRPSSGRPL